MTLKDMKYKILSMLEELKDTSMVSTDDEDIANKLNIIINQIQYELARLKPIPTVETMAVSKDDTLLMNDLDNFYQLNRITGVKYNSVKNEITFLEDGTAKIYYDALPVRIDAKTADTHTFALSDDILEIIPYGVCADILKNDMITNYGEYYSRRYQEMKSYIDPRYVSSIATIGGGIDV